MSKNNSRKWMLWLAAVAVAAVAGGLANRAGTGANVGCGGTLDTEFAAASESELVADYSDGGHAETLNDAGVPLATLPTFDFDGDYISDIVFANEDNGWTTAPMLSGTRQGTWNASNDSARAVSSITQRIPGDFNADGATDIALYRPETSYIDFVSRTVGGDWRQYGYGGAPFNDGNVRVVVGTFDEHRGQDIAFYRPGSNSSTVSVLSSDGRLRELAAPSWANQAGVIAVVGDFDANGNDDLAFYRPGSGWSTVPVLFSSNTSAFRWEAQNMPAPSWANASGVLAMAGQFDRSYGDDLAFRRPGSSWSTVPVLLGQRNKTWVAENRPAPSWANAAGSVAVPLGLGIAFHNPGSTWSSVPVLIGTGTGWRATNQSAPSWANQPGVMAVPGHFNGDSETDIAFYRPGGGWNTLPILFGQLSPRFVRTDHSWASNTNSPAPSWANALGTIAIQPSWIRGRAQPAGDYESPSQPTFYTR